MARKSIVTKKIMQEVAERLAVGDTLTKITKDPAMPSYRAITAAVARDDELFDIYRRGRILQAEYYSDHINDLATAPLPKTHEDGSPVDGRWLGAEIQRRRLEVDTLKWTFARLQPFGIRDKKEDAPQQSAITISWAGGDVAVSGKDE